MSKILYQYAAVPFIGPTPGWAEVSVPDEEDPKTWACRTLQCIYPNFEVQLDPYPIRECPHLWNVAFFRREASVHNLPKTQGFVSSDPGTFALSLSFRDWAPFLDVYPGAELGWVSVRDKAGLRWRLDGFYHKARLRRRSPKGRWSKCGSCLFDLREGRPAPPKPSPRTDPPSLDVWNILIDIADECQARHLRRRYPTYDIETDTLTTES